MSESKIASSPAKRGNWLRKLVWIGGALVVLLIAFFFVATSAAFFKSVILPKVGDSLGADVTVADAQISPFSRVVLRDVKVQPRGAETLLTVREVRASYSLWSIIGGKIAVSELTVDSPVVTVIENADGSSNLDPINEAQAKNAKSATSTPDSSSKPANIDIKKIALNNATVRLVKNHDGGGRGVTEITGLNFEASDIRNGNNAGKVDLSASLSMDKTSADPAQAASLVAKLTANFGFQLAADLTPTSVTGNIVFVTEKATGALAELQGFTARTEVETTPTEIKQLATRFTKAGTAFGELRASGPFDVAKSEGKLKVEILAIDKHLLNLAGAASGREFGTTTINSSNDIEISKGGNLITAVGQLDVARFQMTQQGKTTPTLDLHGDYAVTVDNAASSALLKTLNLTGTQNSQPLLQGGLSSPMTIAWGDSSSAAGDAALNLTVTNLNLADWNAFIDDDVPDGIAGLKAQLTSQKAGKQLAFELDAQVIDLATGIGTERVNHGDLHAQARGSIADLKQIKLDDYQVNITQQGQSALKASGSGTFDSETQDADIQIALQAALGRFMEASTGTATDDTIDFKGRVTNKQNKVTIVGKLALAPTARAKNELQLDGNLDVSNTDAITGSFKLMAESLDVTRYYDLLSAGKPTSTTTQPTSTADASADTTKEPDAVVLPFKDFTFNLNIGHLFLHEVDIANWQLAMLINGGHVVIKPCQLTINDAPVKSTVDLDLGVPGYKYDVSFNATAIPLAPLVNSFVPERKGEVSGTTSANAQLKGAGITGTGLKNNLTGQFDFTTTNMNLSIAEVRSPLLNSVINAIVSIPDLIRNPAAAIGNLLGGLTGGGASKGGWADELTAAPIDVIALNAKAGDGLVEFQKAEVRSKAFQALATGELAFAPILTNSTINIPVTVALQRSLADKAGLVNADTPTNVVYVALPEFFKMKGTLGKPKSDIDKVALLSLVARTGGGVAQQIGGATGEKAGSLLNAVEGLLGGKSKTPGTNSPSTATNAAPAFNPLDLFRKPKSTN